MADSRAGLLLAVGRLIDVVVGVWDQLLMLTGMVEIVAKDLVARQTVTGAVVVVGGYQLLQGVVQGLSRVVEAAVFPNRRPELLVTTKMWRLSIGALMSLLGTLLMKNKKTRKGKRKEQLVKLECAICTKEHYTNQCPLLRGPKPTVAYCGAAEDGMGFF